MPLKIAFNSYSGSGAWLILRLLKEKHKVDYFLSDKEYLDILCGIIPPPTLIRGGNYPNYDKYDLSLFDLTGRKRQSDYSSTQCPTIGDSSFCCQLEDDRDFGMQVMEEAGIMVPSYQRFDEPQAAKKYIKTNGKRYVFKCDGGQDAPTSTTFISCSPQDMLEHIDKMFEDSKGKPFILQEFIHGTEVSTEGFFNGNEFYIINSTLELKKFMNDDLGPATGCAGSLVWTHGLAEPKLYTFGLKKMTKYLRSIGYVGPLDLNSIATPQGIYGLEWTPRFGYDAIANICAMYAGNFGELLLNIATGQIPEQAWKAEYCASVRLTIPPYPSDWGAKHSAGQIVEGIEPEDYEDIYLYDVARHNNHLESAGVCGLLAAPLGCGDSISEAFSQCKAIIDQIKVPGLQYRTDIEKCVHKRYCQLQDDGWLK